MSGMLRDVRQRPHKHAHPKTSNHELPAPLSEDEDPELDAIMAGLRKDSRSS